MRECCCCLGFAICWLCFMSNRDQLQHVEKRFEIVGGFITPVSDGYGKKGANVLPFFFFLFSPFS